MDLTPQQAARIAYNLTLGWISRHSGEPINDIDTGAELQHYLHSKGAYYTMCDDITKSINSTCALSMRLHGKWRDDYWDRSVGVFIGALGIEIDNAPASSFATASAAFVENN